MKWIGQNIYDLISRFRNDVYLEDLSVTTETRVLVVDSSGKISANVTTLGGDLTSIVAGTGLSGTSLTGPIPTLNVDASQPNITTLAGVSAIGTVGTPIEVTCDTVTFSSPTADDPIVTIKNTSNGTNDAASLVFIKDRSDNDVATGTNLAEIYFKGEDSAQNAQEYGRIISEIDVSTNGQESGSLKFGVANHDGGNGYGIAMVGGSANDEVDITIGLGANSVVTIPGDIDLAGDIDVDGTLETDALTIGGATIAAIGTTAITTLGTIGTGVWEGTAIASDQQKHLMHYQVQGYSAGSTNYVAAKVITDVRAPFLHSVDIGSDGLDAQTIQVWMRTGGHTMPNACTLKRFTGWTAAQGSASQTLALFRVRLQDDVDSDPEAVLLQEVTYTASGNATANFFNVTTASSGDAGDLVLAAGDIVFSALKGAGNPSYFNGTFEVEF